MLTPKIGELSTNLVFLVIGP